MQPRRNVCVLFLVCGLGLLTACLGETSGLSERGGAASVTVVPPEKAEEQGQAPGGASRADQRSPKVPDHLRQPTGPERTRPNIVLVTTDDQTLRDMRAMPKTRRLFGKSGVTFKNGIAPNPVCCPARAQIMTGQYSHNNGVRSNFWPYGGYYAFDAANALPVWLQEAGYRTAFMGKYLNQYGRRDPEEVPPGWGVWKGATKGPQGVYDYYNVVLNENGKLHRYPRSYQTDLYAKKSVRLINRFAKSKEPFFLWQSHVAPHVGCRSQFGGDKKPCWHPPQPAKRHKGDFADSPFPQRSDPAYGERDVSNKSELTREKEPLTAGKKKRSVRLSQGRLESLKAVDDAVVRTTAALKEAGVLDETLIVFTSDNGYLLGEHRMLGKNVPYEPALRVPLLMRGPGIPPGKTTQQTGTMVDLAPTILAEADAEAGVRMDGRNLIPIAKGNRQGWDTALLQGGPKKNDDTGQWRFLGVRSSRYTYVEYPQSDEVELYDRKRDSHQLRNLAGASAYKDVEREMKQRLEVLKDCAGDGCRRDFGPEPQPEGSS